MYLFGGGTVRDAVEAFRSGKLQSTADANVQAHAGMGMGRGMGRRVKDMAGGLREQLSRVLMRLDQLEKGEGEEC